MIKRAIATAALAASAAAFSTPAAASDTPFIGEIKAFGFNFCPRGWAKADGSLMEISKNAALFSLLGTMYGGDGRTTFGLPDLRGRTPIGAGTGPGMAPVQLGQKSGGRRLMAGEDVVSTPTLAVTYCIAIVGIYPSRS